MSRIADVSAYLKATACLVLMLEERDGVEVLTCSVVAVDGCPKEVVDAAFEIKALWESARSANGFLLTEPSHG